MAENEAQTEAETPLDPLMEQLGDLIHKDILRRGWEFTIQGKALTPEEVSTPVGLLSILVYQAAQHYKTMTQKELPLYYYANEESLCGLSPAASSAPNSTFVVWSHFTHFALEEWVTKHPELIQKRAPIPLDDLYTAWHEASSRQELVFRAPPTRPSGAPPSRGIS